MLESEDRAQRRHVIHGAGDDSAVPGRYGPGIAPSRFDHIDLVVSSLPRSLEFYRGLLAPLGWTETSQITGERGETVVYLSASERAEWLAANEVTIESPPQEYDYSPGYYAVFFFDPDGIKLELRADPSDPDQR